ncbi:MAG: P-loop ATPase, Sll1717 family [Solirubrobacterales bacterium]
MSRSEVFIGFAALPSNLADTVRSASNRIGKVDGVLLRSWEDLRIGGNLLLSKIEEAIRGADVTIFDLTQLNDNVLFEVGLAIGANKVVWPLRDVSDTTRKNDWKALEVLDPIGQTRFTNSEQIFGKFMEERPDLQGSPLFETTLESQLRGGSLPSVFYFAELFQTDAGRQVASLLQHRTGEELPLVAADPKEASAQTLPWFAQHIYSAEVVIVHLAADRRQGSSSHNARASLIAGLARGMGKPLLMLAEEEYVSALDYRELLFRYPNAEECRTRLEYWLERNLRPATERIADARESAAAVELSTELRSVDLGEYVAENEVKGLGTYYVETATFREIISGSSRVYVGSKGVGKSAAAIQAESKLREDARNLVCTVKPPGYDLDGLVRLLSKFEQRDARGYVAESLWKYLLATELALAVEHDLARRPAGLVPEDPEWQLMEFIGENRAWLTGDFTTRLEQAVTRLLDVPASGEASSRASAVSEALHSGPLRQLREVLGPVLATRRRVYLIIDNLDKAWDKESDVKQLARLLLALLACMDAFRSEMEKTVRKEGMSLSLSLFIRADIFSTVSSLAREPDKLPVRTIRWPDDASLLDVVEQRYVVSQQAEVSPRELWRKYFCSRIKGQSVTDWLQATCLPRPRDVLYLLRSAIGHAVGNRNPRVEVGDLLAAERDYSLFAFEAALVEGQQRVASIEEVLLQFAGAPRVMSEKHVEQTLLGAGVSAGEISNVIGVLQDLSFLGLQVHEGNVRFTSSPREKKKAAILAKRSQGDNAEVQYGMHPAFSSYLEISSDGATLPMV